MKHEPLTFVHASDLHLDSPFKGVSGESAQVARTLRTSTFRAYDEVVDLCLREQADFVVFAGDVYDGCDRSLYAQLRFQDGLKRLDSQGIASFVVHGNHDPLSGWASHLDWPHRAHIFGPDLAVGRFERKGRAVAEVIGISHATAGEQRNLARMFATHADRASNGVFRVGLLHCNVGSDTGHDPYAPCTIDDLRKADIHYWALGHIHKNAVIGQEPHVVYAGNTQGRSIRETGPRGCYIVRVDADGICQLDFHPVDTVRWEMACVSIDGATTLNELDTRISGCLEELRIRAGGRPVVARLELRGRGPLHRELRREQTIPDLRRRYRETFGAQQPFVWLEHVEVACADEVDLEHLALRQDLVGTIVSVAQEYENDPAALDGVLKDLYKKHARFLDAPTPDELQAILRNARTLCIDLLEAR